MTLIVGIVDKPSGTIFMGSDRIVCDGMGKGLLSQPKIFKNGEFLIGSAGYVRGLNLLEYVFEIPDIQGENITKYMVKDFIPALIKCCQENNFYEKKNDRVENLQEILVGVRGHLYSITGGFEVSEVMNQYSTVGYGAYHANGVLEYAINVHKRKDYQKLIREVVTSTSKIVNFVDVGDLEVDVLELKKVKELKTQTVCIYEDGTSEVY